MLVLNNPDKDFKLGEVLINKLGKDLLAYLPANILPALFTFISIPIYTRLFLPEQYGIYALFISAVSLLSGLFFGWLGQSVLRFYHEYKVDEREQFLSSLFIGWLSLLILAYILFFVSSLLFNLDKIEAVTLNIIFYSGLILASSSVYNLVYQLLRADRKTIIFAVLNITLPAARLLLVLALVCYFQIGIEALFIATFLVEFILVAVAFYFVKPSIRGSFFRADILVRSFRYGLPIMLSTVIYWVLSTSDRYIIGYYHGVESVGIYTAGYQIGSQSIQVVFMVLMLASFPIIIQTWTDFGREKTEELVNSLLRYFFMITIPAAVGLAVLSKHLMAVLVESSYFSGHTILPWVALGLLAFGLSQYVNKPFELLEKTVYLFLLSGIAASINLVLNILFVPAYGFIAAAVTTMVSYLSYIAFSLFFSRRYFKIVFNFFSLFRVTVCTVIMGMTLCVIGLNMSYGIINLIILLVVGFVFYFISLLVSGEIKAEYLIIKTKSKLWLKKK